TIASVGIASPGTPNVRRHKGGCHAQRDFVGRRDRVFGSHAAVCPEPGDDAGRGVRRQRRRRHARSGREDRLLALRLSRLGLVTVLLRRLLPVLRRALALVPAFPPWAALGRGRGGSPPPL